MMNQWSFDVERALWGGAGLDVQYLGSHTGHLDRNYYNNTPLPGPGPVQARRTNQRWGVIRTVANDVVENYDGLNVAPTHPPTPSLPIPARHTFPPPPHPGTNSPTH